MALFLIFCEGTPHQLREFVTEDVEPVCGAEEQCHKAASQHVYGVGQLPDPLGCHATPAWASLHCRVLYAGVVVRVDVAVDAA